MHVCITKKPGELACVVLLDVLGRLWEHMTKWIGHWTQDHKG